MNELLDLDFVYYVSLTDNKQPYELLYTDMLRKSEEICKFCKTKNIVLGYHRIWEKLKLQKQIRWFHKPIAKVSKPIYNVMCGYLQIRKPGNIGTQNFMNVRDDFEDEITGLENVDDMRNGEGEGVMDVLKQIWMLQAKGVNLTKQ